MPDALIFDLNERKAIPSAVRILKRGGVVIFPTETVYGMAADPRRRAAINKIFRAKGRAGGKALTLQVDSVAKALRLVKKDPRFTKLARAFWPGPLTIVAPGFRSGKVGVRIPDHTAALGLLKRYRMPLAVTSANVSGESEIWRKEDLVRVFGKSVDLILYENTRPRLASTVVELAPGVVVIHREGRIKSEEINHAIES